jgi:Fe-S oxidoreductase
MAEASQEDQGLDLCASCPGYCRSACPVAATEARESVAPQRLVLQARHLRRGEVAPEVVRELPYRCTGCQACTSACPGRNDVPGLLMKARARVTRRGAAPEEAREVCGAFAVGGTPQGSSMQPVVDEIASEIGLGVERVAETVYLPGCVALSGGPKDSIDLLQGLSLLGRSTLAVTPASSLCCGMALWWSGDHEAFEAHAQMFKSRLRGARRLVVHDPACAYGIRDRYLEVGARLDLEVLSVVDYMASLISSEDLSAARDLGPLAYVDNCQQKRLGVRGSGMRVVRRAAGDRVVEIVADCCGAGGLLPETAPAVSLAMARRWLDTVREQVGDEDVTLVAPSPRCRAHLRRAEPDLRIEDPSRLLVTM